MSFGKIVEWQRSNQDHHIGVDRIERKRSTGLHGANEARVGNRCSHTAVGKTNGIRNMHPAARVDGQFDAWLQEKSGQNEDLQPGGRRFLPFDQIIFAIAILYTGGNILSVIVSATFLTMPIYTMVAIIYFVVVFAISRSIQWLTRKIPTVGYFRAAA